MKGFDKRIGWRLLLILAVAALLYRPIVRSGFVYDDLWMIVKNPSIRRVTPALFFMNPETGGAPGSQLTLGNFRPLAVLSFSLDYRFWGLLPLPYHVENFLWHAINALLLFFLLRRLLKNDAASLLGTGLFLIHPVQVETAAWAAQRSNLLCAFGFLAGLLFLSSSHRPSWAGLAGGLLAYGLALFSKEEALVFPLMLVLCDWVGTAKLRERARLYAAVLLLTLLYAVIRMKVGHPWSLVAPGEASVIYDLAFAILSYSIYLGKLICPLALRPSYDYPAMPNIWHIAGGLAIVVFYAWSIWKAAGRSKVLALGLAWVPITLLPVLHLLPFRLFVAERFLYFPVMGVAIAIAWLYQQFKACRPAVYLWTGYLAVMTALSVPHWQTEQSLWASAVEAEPTNAFAHMCYAECLKDLSEAERHYKLALVNDPSPTVRFGAANNLSWLYLSRRQPRPALYWAQKAAGEQPQNPMALYNLCRAYEANHETAKAREVYRRLKALSPPDSPLIRALAKGFEGS